jgi:cellulose synthase/poly-beta-1,6-N-acetylglucosamine synthase-like glycosyltransferase
LWVIVDDGSTDETPEILAEYMARHDWIRVVKKPDRGHRAVGPGVIEAFYAGWKQSTWKTSSISASSISIWTCRPGISRS